MVDRFDIQYETHTPASVVFDLGPKRIRKKESDWSCKQAVGALLWILGVTQPDVASGVRAVTGHAHILAPRHLKAARKIISYFKATKDRGAVSGGRGLETVVIR